MILETNENDEQKIASHSTFVCYGDLRRVQPMGNLDKAKWFAPPVENAAMRYGLALVSVAAAAGLTQLFLYFHLPLVFNALALSAIAVTFWYAGTKPGVLTAVLSALVRSYIFDPA